MKKTLNLFLLFFVVLFSACAKSQPAVDLNIGQTNVNQPNEVEPVELTGVELEEYYQASLKEILKPFWEGNEIVGLKDQILDLKAPAKYLNLHLEIVIALESIEQGQASSDQDKIEQGLEKVAKLKVQYPWIRDAE